MNGTSPIESKQAIRQLIKEQKKQLSLQEKDEFSYTIFQALAQQDVFQKAHSVLCYWSMPDEVQTHTFILDNIADKTWLLPVIAGNSLEIRRFIGLDNLKQGILGIEEPIGEPYDGTIDLAIIPGLAFDRKGNRLGRGKGFYDQFLSQHAPYTIAVAFHCQLINEVPVEPWDITMQQIITEQETIFPISNKLD
jgi:5-formyltetrahydrofolate cyclo-ligase